MPSGQAITTYVGGNPICSLVQWLWEHFGASITSTTCLWAVIAAEQGTMFIHAVMHWRPFTCVHICWIFICAHPPTPTISRHTGKPQLRPPARLNPHIEPPTPPQMFSFILTISLKPLLHISEASCFRLPFNKDTLNYKCFNPFSICR